MLIYIPGTSGMTVEIASGHFRDANPLDLELKHCLGPNPDTAFAKNLHRQRGKPLETVCGCHTVRMYNVSLVARAKKNPRSHPQHNMDHTWSQWAKSLISAESTAHRFRDGCRIHRNTCNWKAIQSLAAVVHPMVLHCISFKIYPLWHL